MTTFNQALPNTKDGKQRTGTYSVYEFNKLAITQPLLDRLFEMIMQPRFHYRHRWRDGDLVIWDNRCLTHQACGGYSLPDIRRMHRTTIRGDRPFYRPAA